MRVSTMQMHNTMSGSMQQASSDVNRTLIEMSTGKRILKPSDDPFAAMQLMGMDDELNKLEIWSGNIDTATASLSNQETVLSDMNNNMNRARDLVLSAGNGSMSNEDLDAIATELEQTMETIASLANTKSSSGEYIFGGTAGDQPPVQEVPVLDADGNPVLDTDGNPVMEWSYQGSDTARELQISDSQTASLGVTGDDLFFGSDPDFFTAMDDFVETLRTVDMPDDQEILDQAIEDTLGVIDDTQGAVNKSLTTIGAEINSLEAAASTNADLQLTNKAMQSSLEDLDYTEAVTRLSVEQTILTATQKGYANVSQMSLFNYI